MLVWLVRKTTFASRSWPRDSASKKACSRDRLLTLDQNCGPLLSTTDPVQSVVCAISTRKQTDAQLTPLNLEYCPLVLFGRITNFKDHFKQKARPTSRKQGQRQADLWEFETNMVYIAHSWPAKKEEKITIAVPCRKYNA